MLGTKKHVCRALIRRLTVLTIAADVEPWPSSASTPSVGGRGAGGGLLSKLLDLAADVVDYVLYFGSKYAKKDGRVEGDKEGKLQTLQRYFVHFIITAAPHLNCSAPASAWTPEMRSRIFDVLVPQLHLSRCLLPSIDASTHSAFSDRSVDSTNSSTHGRGGGGAGGGAVGEEEWSLKALRAMAAVQSGPAITMSASTLHLLGLEPVTAVQGEGKSMQLLEQWINKALLAYQGEWLESSRDFLFSFLVGNTQAVTWSLDCCYSGNMELAHSHFHVLSRFFVSHDVPDCAPEEALLLALYMLGDPTKHIRQCAARLLILALARASRAHPCHQSLPEISGTDYLNALRLDALQLRASEKSAHFVSAYCAGEMGARVLSALIARVLNAPCTPQQRLLLSLSLPWMERLDLSAASYAVGEDGKGGGGAGARDGKGGILVAEMLHLTRRVSAALPKEVLAMWTALGSKKRANVEICIQRFVSMTQRQLSSPDLTLQSLATLQLATDGMARGARVPTITLLSSKLEAQVRQLVAGSVDSSGISPAALLGAGGFSGVVKVCKRGGWGGRIWEEDTRRCRERRMCKRVGCVCVVEWELVRVRVIAHKHSLLPSSSLPSVLLGECITTHALPLSFSFSLSFCLPTGRRRAIPSAN